MMLTGAGHGSAAGPAITDGLLAHYRFDSDVNDSSGNARHMSGSPTFTTALSPGGDGLLGHAITGGTSPTAAAVSLAFSDLAVSVWVDFFSSATGSTAETGVTGAAGAGVLTVTASRVPQTVTVAADGVDQVTSAALVIGPWHHVVASCKGGVLTVWVDGVIIGTGTAPAAGTIEGIKASCTSRLQTDEFAVYGRDLSASNVLQLYNNGIGRDPTA